MGNNAGKAAKKGSTAMKYKLPKLPKATDPVHHFDSQGNKERMLAKKFLQPRTFPSTDIPVSSNKVLKVGEDRDMDESRFQERLDGGKSAFEGPNSAAKDEMIRLRDELRMEQAMPKVPIAEVQRKDEDLVKSVQYLMDHIPVHVEKTESSTVTADGEHSPLPLRKSLVRLDYWNKEFPGTLSWQQMKEFYRKRILNPKHWTAERLAGAYDLDVTRVKHMLMYYAVPSIVEKYEGMPCAVWPAEAMEMIAIQKGMSDAFDGADFAIHKNMSPGLQAYLRAEVGQKDRNKRMKKYDKAEGFVQGFSAKEARKEDPFLVAEKQLIRKRGGDVEATLKAEAHKRAVEQANKAEE